MGPIPWGGGGRGGVAGPGAYIYIYNIIRIIANPLPSEQTTMAPGKSLQDKKNKRSQEKRDTVSGKQLGSPMHSRLPETL